MDEKAQQKADKERAARRYASLGAKEVVYSSIAAAVSFFVAAGASIRKAFNEEFAYRPLMKDFEVPATEADKFRDVGFKINKMAKKPSHGYTSFKGLLSEHGDALFDNEMKLVRGLISPEKQLENTLELKSKFASKKADILENVFKIRTKGIWNGMVLGTWDRFKEIGKSSDRMSVGLAGISAAAVVGVTIYNVLTSIATRKKAREIEDILLDKALLKTDKTDVVLIEHKEGEPNVKVSQVTHDSKLSADIAPALSAARS